VLRWTAAAAPAVGFAAATFGTLRAVVIGGALSFCAAAVTLGM
jgi:Na+/glutamate symporter